MEKPYLASSRIVVYKDNEVLCAGFGFCANRAAEVGIISSSFLVCFFETVGNGVLVIFPRRQILHSNLLSCFLRFGPRIALLRSPLIKFFVFKCPSLRCHMSRRFELSATPIETLLHIACLRFVRKYKFPTRFARNSTFSLRSTMTARSFLKVTSRFLSVILATAKKFCQDQVQEARYSDSLFSSLRLHLP